LKTLDRTDLRGKRGENAFDAGAKRTKGEKRKGKRGILGKKNVGGGTPSAHNSSEIDAKTNTESAVLRGGKEGRHWGEDLKTVKKGQKGAEKIKVGSTISQKRIEKEEKKAAAQCGSTKEECVLTRQNKKRKGTLVALPVKGPTQKRETIKKKKGEYVRTFAKG